MLCGEISALVKFHSHLSNHGANILKEVLVEKHKILTLKVLPLEYLFLGGCEM